jgi:hypothetical protein
MFRFLVTVWRSEFAVEEGDDTNERRRDNHGQRRSVKADSVCLHGNNLRVFRERAEGDEGGKQYRRRNNLGNHHRNPEEKKRYDLVQRCFMVQEHSDSFKKFHNQEKRNKQQEDENKNPDEFFCHVTIENGHKSTALFFSDELF